MKFRSDGRRGRMAEEKSVNWRCQAAVRNPREASLGQLGEFCNVAVLLNNVAVSLHNVEKDTSSI